MVHRGKADILGIIEKIKVKIINANMRLAYIGEQDSANLVNIYFLLTRALYYLGGIYGRDW